jgi:hypothetical protein
MVEVEMRDENGIDRVGLDGVHPADPTEMQEPGPEQRIGQHADPVHVDEYGGVPDVHDARRHGAGIV